MELPANILTPTVSHYLLSSRGKKPMVPQAFCRRVKDAFKDIENVEIFVHDEGQLLFKMSLSRLASSPHFYQFQHGLEKRGWYIFFFSSRISRKLKFLTQRTFLSVTNGTAEPAKILEMFVCSFCSAHSFVLIRPKPL